MRVPSVALVSMAAVGVVNAQGSVASWHPPTAGDSRGPCPMLNTLANHEFLPHNGRNFTLDNVKHALTTALNFTDELAELLNKFALTTNLAANATTWGLDTLSNHNILEHDASLSRADNFFNNDSTSFNQTVFDRTRAFWTAPWINIQMAANARLARMIDSVKFNRQFALSELAGAFSAGEGAAYLLVFGDRQNQTANRDMVEFFFENERLPIQMGWKTPSPAISSTVLLDMSALVVNATNYQSQQMMTPW